MTILTTIPNGASYRDIRDTLNSVLARLLALEGNVGTPTPTPTPAPTPAPSAKVLAEGDSITAFNASSDNWDSYARLWKAANPTVAFQVSAVGGAALGASGDAAGANTLYGRLSADQAYAPTLLSVLIGANDDVSGTYLSRVLAYIATWRNAGIKVIAGTVLPRQSGPNNANRGAFNQGLRDAVGTGKLDGVFDFDTCPAGVDGAGSDATLYPDGLHPSAKAQGQMLRVYSTELNWQLGRPNEPLDFTYVPANGAAADTDVTSAAYTVKGLHAGETRPYQAGAAAYVSKNGGAYALAGSGTVVNGDTLRLRRRSAAAAAGQANATLTVGATQATFTVTTAGAGSRDWAPSDLGAKLAMWVKPETLGASGANVDSWADQSGKGNTLTAETSGGSGRPSVVAGSINGLKAVRFDPAQQAWFAAPTSLLTDRTSLATFFVSKNSKDPNTTNYGAPLGSFGTEGGDYWVYNNGGIYSGFGTNTRRDNMDAPGLTTDWHQFMQLSAPGDWRISQDGTDFGVFTANTVSVGTAPKVGRSPGIQDIFDGFIAEIVDMNVAPTSSERGLVEGYLAWKFGLQGSLPADHPYKSAKPTI